MKTIEQLTNVDKAKIMFDLFRDQMPEFLDYAKSIADKIVTEEETLIQNWNNPFLTYHQWKTLGNQVNLLIKKYGKGLTKSGNVFADQLFSGYTAIFTNHCLEQFANKTKSEKFKRAISLFYLPVVPGQTHMYLYIVLELHGGPEYAAIVTDQQGVTMVFDTREAAETEAATCQDGFVVEI